MARLISDMNELLFGQSPDQVWSNSADSDQTSSIELFAIPFASFGQITLWFGPLV